MRTNYYGAYYTLHDGKFTHKEQAARHRAESKTGYRHLPV